MKQLMTDMHSQPDPTLDMPGIHDSICQLVDNMCRVVLGKTGVVQQCVIGLLAGEHVLLEDVPGVGKTLMGRALSRSLDGEFCRLQFTPDLLPSDIVGSTVFNTNTSEFIYHKGPIFSNIVLADEINRAPPRTQSALLEAMGDRQVSVDGVTYDLPSPFMVIATQNPYEIEGTYLLPENQMDRFLLRISMGYPDREEERQVLMSHREGEPVESLDSVMDVTVVARLQEAVRAVRVDPSLYDYVLDVIAATRSSDELHVGVSPRGAISLCRAAQAAALMDGRDYVVPDDVKQLAVPALAHRVISRGHLQTGNRDVLETIIRDLVEATPIPE
jgi:MoxR-like ATPase